MGVLCNGAQCRLWHSGWHQVYVVTTEAAGCGKALFKSVGKGFCEGQKQLNTQQVKQRVETHQCIHGVFDAERYGNKRQQGG